MLRLEGLHWGQNFIIHLEGLVFRATFLILKLGDAFQVGSTMLDLRVSPVFGVEPWKIT
jgi:hypothetical protein